MQSKNKIMKILSQNGIEYFEPDIKSDLEYNREIIIKTYNNNVKLTWWSNIMYMDIGGAIIPFNDLSVDGCWPNHFSVNINLMNGRVKVAIIPISKLRI